MRELALSEVENITGGDGSFTISFSNSAGCVAAAGTGAYFGSFFGATLIGAGTGYILGGCISFS